MSIERHRLLERFAIATMLIGIVGMFQPLIFDLYAWGFLLLLFSTIGFTIISNITPRYSEKLTTDASAKRQGNAEGKGDS